MPTVEVSVAEPLRLTREVLADPARFKVCAFGRRTQKTRLDFHASMFGHGPKNSRGLPKWSGLIQGKDIVWLGPDFPQLEAIWYEEIKPRFGGVDGFELNEQRHSLTVTGLGTLWLVSFENVAKVRGRGARLGGVVVDEAAHYDLRYAWRRVIRPTLMDCGGWALITSTTNSGPDGARDEQGTLVVPSYFNTLCLDIRGGVRKAPDWKLWQADARQNETIDPQEFEELVAEYGDKSSVELREEVFAELLTDGAGLAFPEWRDTIHIARPPHDEPDIDATCAAGMDWGHGTPGWFGLFYSQPNNRLLLRREWYFKRTRAKKAGFAIGKMCLASPAPVQWIALDSACFSKTGVGATIAEKLQEGIEVAYARSNARHETQLEAPAFIPAPKPQDAIRHQKTLLHEVLGWEEDEDGVLVEPPALLVHSDCRDFARTIARLPEDPKDRNKFDTKGEDHPAQGAAYYLTLRAPEYESHAEERRVQEERKKLDHLSRREAESYDKMVAAAEKKVQRLMARRR